AFTVAPADTVDAVVFAADPAVTAHPTGVTDPAVASGPDDALLASDGRYVTPIPDELPVGDIAGYPLVVGGHDLDDTAVTLVAYDGADAPREVLYGWTTPDADHKILAALALDDEHLVPTEVTRTVQGRLPLDEQHQLYEQLEKVVKSVNHHLKAGGAIPAHTHDNHTKLTAALGQLTDAATGDELQMLEHYQSACAQIAERLADGYATPYQQGGKIGHLAPHQVAGEVTITEMVPAPAEDVPAGLLAATIRPATRIKPTLDPATGAASWDGIARYTGQTGVEYRIDLGDGYEAIYRPHVAAKTNDRISAGQRGFLEVVAPPGAGHSRQLVARLGQLHLCNRPMTAPEAEWTYLQRNVWAQNLTQHPTVAAAAAQAATLDDSLTELVLAERADQAVGLSDRQLTRFARDVRLEGEARALPAKTRLVGDAVATQLGFADLDQLRAQPGYDPTPRRSGGWHVWDRWDVAGAPDDVDYKGRALYHRVTGNNVADMIRNSGLLAATERRRVMGIKPGLGMSETADMATGGSRAVDLRIGTPPSKGPYLVWSDPSRLLRRADWYAYSSDHFAAAVDEGGHSTKGQTRSPAKVATFTAGSNEVLFRNGIDLLSPHEAPDRIVCASTAQRGQVLAALNARGITHLAGTPIDQAVTT
ncbi:MAG: hypothetical protein M3N52_07900, partial [Actinomycetota bacterium]|nr:hypothetical protein [Actinomycetota bacterium]